MTKNSLTYHITLLVIRLKGIKKTFSKDPINYKKLRKEDVYNPKGNFFKRNILRKFKILNSTITEIGVNKSSDKLLIFIHGGAFVSGPSQHHWDAVKYISKEINHKIWLCNYPKAPENKITFISKNIDEIYFKAKEKYSPSNICIIGDSVGGTLVTSLVQRLIKRKIELPKKIILISPVMDASMSNPKIKEIEKIDPMLSLNGVLSAKKMCSGNLDLKNPIISPIYESFEGFPSTTLFTAQKDIMYPDEKIFIQKMKESGVNIEIVEGINMPHIWPFLPFMKEAKFALRKW